MKMNRKAGIENMMIGEPDRNKLLKRRNEMRCQKCGKKM
jgi:hypothetical protein